MITPDIAYQACRFLHDTSLMLLWGCSAFLSVLASASISRRVWPKFTGFVLAAVIVAILTTAIALPLQTGIIGNGWVDTVNPATIHDVLFDTTAGRAWQVQAVTNFFLLLAFLAPRHLRPAALALTAGLGLASLTLTGHAAMHQGWFGFAHRLNDIVHLLAAGSWFGALVPLLPILRLLEVEECRRDAGRALKRFSNIGHAAVALVILSGLINTALILGRLPTNWASPYQAMLAFKIAVVTCMTMLAIINRYVFVPRIGRQPQRALAAIRTGTIVEIALGIVAIACVAVFGMLEPA
ncbi:copper homeostasis membrane protein CopD [Rhizobium sp. BK376]|uniref:copper homeostasis membrane protein CopD n=1 Tax=Rhizobium sp. BK376 TaxID=2512149 RepID=UPI00104835F1|nr:copper homeostasis membrane protein CopD [Rhizobium sp. BK376]